MKYIVLFALTITLVAASPFNCRDNETSCEAGCCPYQNAVCCGSDACCPEGYKCNLEEGTCYKEGASDFLSFVGIMKKVEARNVSFPDINDIITCIKDVIPVISEVKEALDDYNKGETGKLLEVLLRLVKDGSKLTTDCGKVIGEFVLSQ